MCRSKTYTALIISLLFFASCKKDALMTYEGVRSLHFKMLESSYDKLDSIPVNISFIPKDSTDIPIHVLLELLGPISDEDLEYELQIDSDNTSLPQSAYRIKGKYLFPKGKNIDTLQINLIKIAEGTAGKLALRLKSNANFQNDIFQTDLKRDLSNRLQIYFSNIVEIPKGWSTEPLGDLYVGVFSKEKLLLISKLTIEKSGNESWTPEMVTLYFMSYRSTFGSFLNDYLELMREKGTPVLEKDGSQMKAGPYFD